LAPIAIAKETTGDSDSGDAADSGSAESGQAADNDGSADSGQAADDDSANGKGKSNREERKDNREERQGKREAHMEKKEEIKALREKVKAACEDKQSQECKDARMEARGAKHDILGRIAEKMGPTFKRADQLKKKLAQVVAHLAKKGKDVSGLNTGAIEAKITEAQNLFDEGKVLFEQARNAEPGQKDELMKQAAQKFRAANAALKEVRSLIRDWLKSVRGKDPAAVDESTPAETPAPAETAASPAPADSDSDEADDDSDEKDGHTDKADDDADEDDATTASPAPTATA